MKFLNRKNLWVFPAIAGLGLAWHVANAQEQGQAGKTQLHEGGQYRIIRVDHGKNDSGKARD